MKSRRSIAVINASLESSISGIRVTKAFTNAEKEREKFEDGNGQFIEARREAYNAMGQFHSTTAFVTDILMWWFLSPAACSFITATSYSATIPPLSCPSVCSSRRS